MNGNGYYEKDGTELSIDITTHEAFIEKATHCTGARRNSSRPLASTQRPATKPAAPGVKTSTWATLKRAWVGKTCGSVNEPWNSLDTFNVQWLLPVGERANRDAWRWSGEVAEQYSAIVDEMGSLPLGDPQVEALFIEAMGLWFNELPVIPITQAKKIIPFDTTYWTGWPTFEDDYIHPPTWWQHTHVIIHNLEPTGAE